MTEVFYGIRRRQGGRAVHPGEVLLEQFMRPHEISQNALARTLCVPPRRINEIVLGKRAITVDTALRLEDALGMPAKFWMALQSDYDIQQRREDRLDKVRLFPPPLPILYGGDVPLEGDLDSGYDVWRY